jgi:hypothetical protein
VTELQKVLAMTVGAAMFVAAVAPKSQTGNIIEKGGNAWQKILATLTGSAKLS